MRKSRSSHLRFMAAKVSFVGSLALLVIVFVLGLILLSGCGTEPGVPQPTITYTVTPEPGPYCLWMEHVVEIRTRPADTTYWTVEWLDEGRNIEAGRALPGMVGVEPLYLPTYRSTVVEIIAWASHGGADTAWVGSEAGDWHYLADLPGITTYALPGYAIPAEQIRALTDSTGDAGDVTIKADRAVISGQSPSPNQTGVNTQTTSDSVAPNGGRAV